MKEIVNYANKLIHIDNNTLFDVRDQCPITIYPVGDRSRFVLIDGKKVDYGLLLLKLHDRFSLPEEYWDRVKTEIIDTSLGWEINNISIRYPVEGIPHPTHKGFYYIPGLENNVIAKNGKYIRLRDGKVRTVSLTEKMKQDNICYPSIQIVDGVGNIVTRVLHRLLAIVFKNPPLDYPNLVVDHINNLKWDFSLDNLWWVTHGTNNTKAVSDGLRTDRKEITVKDLKTGTVTSYFSVTDFSRKLDVHPQYLIDAMNRSGQTFRERFVIKAKEDERDWSKIMLSVSASRGPLKSRNVFTGEIEHFSGFSDAYRKVGVVPNALTQYFNLNSDPAIIKDREWKRESDETPWYEFNEYQKEIAKRGMHRKTTVYRLWDADQDVGIYYGWKPISEITGFVKRTIIVQSNAGRALNHRYRAEILH